MHANFGWLDALILGLVARTDLAAGTDEQKIADAYRSYMDEARIEALDDQPIQPLLAEIRTIDGILSCRVV